MSQSGKKKSSSRSRGYSTDYGSVSDIEREDSDDSGKYKKLAKKLSKDKSELKDKLRKLIDDTERIARDHRMELQKTQDYFQRQITDLSNQKDELVQDLKRKSSDKQQNSKHLDLLEKRIQNKDEQIKKLEETLAKNQEKLFEMETSSTHNDKVSMQQEYYKKLISSLETENKILSEKDKYNTRNVDEIVNKVKEEKDIIIYTLQRKLQDVSDKFSKMEKEKEEHKINTETKTSMLESEFKNKTEEIKKAYEIQYEEIRGKFEVHISRQKHEHDMEMDKLKKEHEKKMESLVMEYKSAMGSLDSDVKLRLKKKDEEVTKMKTFIEKEKAEMQEDNKRLTEYIKQLKENAKKQQDTANLTNAQFIATSNKQKELAEKEIQSRNDIIAQLEAQLNKLGEESVERINSLESKIRTLQADAKEATQKYIDIKILHEKSSFEANFFKPEIERLRGVVEKLSEKLKITMDAHETVQTLYKTAQHQIQQKDIVLSKQSIDINTLMDSIAGMDREYNDVKAKLKIAEASLQDLKNDTVRASAENSVKTEKLRDILEERSILEDKVRRLQMENDNMNRQISIAEEKITALHRENANITVNLDNKSKIVNDRYEELKKYEEKMKDKIISSEQNEKLAQQYKDEAEKMRNEIIRIKGDFVSKLNIITKDLNKAESERDAAKKQVSFTEERLNKLQFEFASATAMITNKTELLNDRNAQLQKFEEKMKEKIMASDSNERLATQYKQEAEKLRGEISRIKADFVAKLNAMTKTTEETKEQLDYFREHSKGVVQKEKEIVELIKTLNDAKVSMAKAENSYKAEIETLNRKVQELKNENETLKNDLQD